MQFWKRGATMAKVGAVTSARVKNFRKAQGVSAYELGCKLGCTRSYIKSIEGGSLPVSHSFAVRFSQLERRTYAEQTKGRTIQSKHPLPAHVKILARPRRCKICGEWFVFPDQRQRVCTGAACKREARKRASTRRANPAKRKAVKV